MPAIIWKPYSHEIPVAAVIMGDNDKPFVCTHTGCGMRFANEDHLGVHQLKHEMSLALTPGTKPGGFLQFADQTPTPTKFLKNCEEIGLFHELTKNPFEEAFKKASETISETKTIEVITELDAEALNTPTPQMGNPSNNGSARTITPSKEFIPLPGPDTEMGSTIACTPGGSACGPAKAACPTTPVRTSTSTPAGTPTSSSTMGLPFKLKLKREPLGENELSMLPGGVVSPSIPKKDTVTEHVEQVHTVKSEPCATTEQSYRKSVVPPAHAAVSCKNSSPAKIAMVTPTPCTPVVPSESIVTSTTSSSGIQMSDDPSSINNSSYVCLNSAKPPQYYLQVMIQMPSGEMMPVQIPAAISTGTTVSMTTQPVTTVARMDTSSVLVSSTTTMFTSTNTIMSQCESRSSGAASSLTKQKLKAALQQSVLTSNMRIMSEAVDRITTDSSDQQQQPHAMLTMKNTEAPLPHIQTTSPVRQPALAKGPSSQLMSPASSVATTLSPDMDDFDDEDEDEYDELTLKKRARRFDDDPDERRKKFLERNRAAAARCRQKKKTWITNLERKADELQSTNNKLQQEVTMLRSEVAQLKTLLLAHKDCPITMQLQNPGLMKPGV